MPLDLAELRQRNEHAVAGIDHQMLVRVWQELDYRIDVCRFTKCAWNTCEVCAETLRDTVSSGTNLSSTSAMVTDLDSRYPRGTFDLPCIKHINNVKNETSLFEKILK